MSSRESLWFCHACQIEIHPLMVPDPVCPSCHESFVEKMDDTADDPREFAHSLPVDPEGDALPPGIDTFLLGLQALVDRGLSDSPRSPHQASNSSGPGRVSFEIRTGSGNSGSRAHSGPDHAPTMSEYLRRGSEANEGSTITGQLMAQYLMALLGNRNDLFGRGMNDLGSGRMGDYVFNQEALDHIVTQLMENSNAHRPVPATDQIIANLPREVLEHGSPLLEKDCAVCKEQFKLGTEDPDEQIVITLPCKHPFHEPCILPWLKSSGTCPVCRYALVQQPEQHTPPNPSPDSRSSRRQDQFSNSSLRNQRSPPRDSNSLLQSLFGGLVGGSNSFGRNTGSSSRHSRSNSDPPSRASGRRNDSGSHFPGSWTDDLD